VAKPLGLEFYIGLPKDIPASRIAKIDGYKKWQLLFNMDKMPRSFVLSILNPFSITFKTFANPAILGELNGYNERQMQQVELPASNGIG
jgi:hypothetical protein